MIETKTASAIVTMAIVAIVAAPRPAQGADRREVRAIWVTRWDYVSAYDVRTAIRNCASLGLNRVYFQVRGQADAFYRSTLEPWSEELKGDPKRGGDPGYDPLAIAVTAARESGVELYAWINVLPGWRGKKPARDRRHLFHRHPEWFMTDGRGRRQLLARETDRYSLLNPCRSEVRAHLRAVVAEIAQNYAIDGVQFDYLRYLRRNVSKGEDVPLDAATVATFRKRFGREPGTLPGAWNRFRQDAMDLLVRELASAIRSRNRPTVRSSERCRPLSLGLERPNPPRSPCPDARGSDAAPGGSGVRIRRRSAGTERGTARTRGATTGPRHRNKRCGFSRQRPHMPCLAVHPFRC